MSELEYWNAHDLRGKLHDPSIWTPMGSLTYVASGIGATGQTQLSALSKSHPPHTHPFSSHQRTRYSNQFRVNGQWFDEGKGVVCEELFVSGVSGEDLGYLVPGVPASQRTISCAFMLIAEMVDVKEDKSTSSSHTNGGSRIDQGTQIEREFKLQNVKVYWDNAMLLKQLGAYEHVFNNLLQNKSFLNALDAFPVANASSLLRRLGQPSEHNSVQVKAGRSNEVLMGENGFKGMADSLPVKSVFESNLFDADPKDADTRNRCSAINKDAVKTSLVFTDEEEPRRTTNNATKSSSIFGEQCNHLTDNAVNGKKLAGIKSSAKASSIFGEQHKTPMKAAPPSLHLDPTRNQSKVFIEPASPFHPRLPLTEQSRFQSRVFGNDPNNASYDASPAPSQAKKQKDNRQCSHIFDADSPTASLKTSRYGLTRTHREKDALPWEKESDLDPLHPRPAAQARTGLAQSKEESEKDPATLVGTKPDYNKSSIFSADNSANDEDCVVSSGKMHFNSARAADANATHFVFGDNL